MIEMNPPGRQAEQKKQRCVDGSAGNQPSVKTLNYLHSSLPFTFVISPRQRLKCLSDVLLQSLFLLSQLA
jgi:hypothetical protein